MIFYIITIRNLMISNLVIEIVHKTDLPCLVCLFVMFNKMFIDIIYIQKDVLGHYYIGTISYF